MTEKLGWVGWDFFSLFYLLFFFLAQGHKYKYKIIRVFVCIISKNGFLMEII